MPQNTPAKWEAFENGKKIKIKHCPFCFEKNDLYILQGVENNRTLCAIQCESCFARGSVAYSAIEAVKFWNKRNKENGKK